MHSGFTAHVTSAEWRWVVIVSLGLLLLAFAPFALIALNSPSATDWMFMGILHNSRDGATYLSKMLLGVNGDWLVHFQHTPESHNSAFIQVMYPFLGHIAALLGAPVLIVFHVSRAIAALVMYLALYQLAATIWMRIRTRRIFFVLVALGSGFGWLYTLLTNGGAQSPDILMPEAFPFYSSLVNVHFPLSIACLALLVGIVIDVFRPGVEDEPHVGNNGLAAVLLSLLLGVLYPQSLVPMGGALVLYAGLRWRRRRKVVWRELSWLLVILLPVVPLAVYYWAIITYNPAMAAMGAAECDPGPASAAAAGRLRPAAADCAARDLPSAAPVRGA